jgi:hypothetical protein
MEALEIAKKEALRVYRAEEKKGVALADRSPAGATKKAAEKSGLSFAKLVPVVAAVYYRENGNRAEPIGGSGLALAKKVARCRAAGGRLARWEVLSYRVAAGLGRPEPVSIPVLKALDLKGREALGLVGNSYVGKGTRIAAPETKTDDTAEIATA